MRSQGCPSSGRCHCTSSCSLELGVALGEGSVTHRPSEASLHPQNLGRLLGGCGERDRKRRETRQKRGERERAHKPALALAPLAGRMGWVSELAWRQRGLGWSWLRAGRQIQAQPNTGTAVQSRDTLPSRPIGAQKQSNNTDAPDAATLFLGRRPA